MPTEAELEQLFVRVSELEAWRAVKEGRVQKEVPKEPLAKPMEAAPKGPFPPVPPKPSSKDEDDNNKTSFKK